MQVLYESGPVVAELDHSSEKFGFCAGASLSIVMPFLRITWYSYCFIEISTVVSKWYLAYRYSYAHDT